MKIENNMYIAIYEFSPTEIYTFSLMALVNGAREEKEPLNPFPLFVGVAEDGQLEGVDELGIGAVEVTEEFRTFLDSLRFEAVRENAVVQASNSISAIAAREIEYACIQYSVVLDVVDQGLYDLVPLSDLLAYATDLKTHEE